MSTNGYSNGHSNGHHNGNGIAPSKRDSGEHNRSEVQALCRAVLSGWLQTSSNPLQAMTEAIKALREVATSSNAKPGTKAMAAKALAEALQQSVGLALKLSEMEDKQDRLNTPGGATERVEYNVRMPEARDRMGVED